jgi:hypothetical protein
MPLKGKGKNKDKNHIVFIFHSFVFCFSGALNRNAGKKLIE